jgi:hypothetical protein
MAYNVYADILKKYYPNIQYDSLTKDYDISLSLKKFDINIINEIYYNVKSYFCTIIHNYQYKLVNTSNNNRYTMNITNENFKILQMIDYIYELIVFFQISINSIY